MDILFRYFSGDEKGAEMKRPGKVPNTCMSCSEMSVRLYLMFTNIYIFKQN